MNKNKIKLGIVGGGMNSTIGKAHISALRMDGNFDIVSGFFSRNKKINYQTLKFLNINIDKNYKNLEQYLKYELKNIDVFLILTDSFSHFENINTLLKTKKPIICEKPTAVNLNDLKKIINKINKTKIRYFPFYNYTGYPSIRDIKHLLKNNLIGKIHNIELTMPQQSLSSSKIKNAKKWRLKDYVIPTIQLDLGVHLLIILKFIYPNIKINKVISNEESFKKINLVHTIDSWLKFNSEGICKINITKNEIGQRNELSIKINGSKGSIKWNHSEPENITIFNIDGKKMIMDRNDKELKISKEKRYNRYSVGHPYGFIESMANYYQDIFNDIKKKDKKSKQYLIALKDEYFAIKILEKLHKSHLLKKWINF